MYKATKMKIDDFNHKKDKLTDLNNSAAHTANISGLATQLTEKAADVIFHEGYKRAPGRGVVGDIISRQVHDMKAPLMKASNEYKRIADSEKGGKQEHNIAEEGSKDRPENPEKDVMKQENEVTTHRDKRLKPLTESSDETIKSSDEANKKRDSIRPRL